MNVQIEMAFSAATLKSRGISNGKRSSHEIRLPASFQPGQHTVVCGRGKICSESSGNKNLKKLIRTFLHPYGQAKNKGEKSNIVSTIIHAIQQHSSGRFVKEEQTKGGPSQWWEVSESFKREKVGCMFRDMLYNQYKSSTKAKHARKMQRGDIGTTSNTIRSYVLPPKQVTSSLEENTKPSIVPSTNMPSPTSLNSCSLMSMLQSKHQGQMESFFQFPQPTLPHVVTPTHCCSSPTTNSMSTDTLSIIQEVRHIIDNDVLSEDTNNNSDVDSFGDDLLVQDSYQYEDDEDGCCLSNIFD